MKKENSMIMFIIVCKPYQNNLSPGIRALFVVKKSRDNFIKMIDD